MWPASMLAKSRIISANGFVNMLRISTGIMIGSSQAGSPGGTMSVKWRTTPYFEIPAYCCARNETMARASVTARLPVEVAANGIRPRSAATRMKKKKLHRSGRELAAVAWPMFFSAMSSRMNSTSASTAAPSPRGTALRGSCASRAGRAGSRAAPRARRRRGASRAGRAARKTGAGPSTWCMITVGGVPRGRPRPLPPRRRRWPRRPRGALGGGACGLGRVGRPRARGLGRGLGRRARAAACSSRASSSALIAAPQPRAVVRRWRIVSSMTRNTTK